MKVPVKLMEPEFILIRYAKKDLLIVDHDTIKKSL